MYKEKVQFNWEFFSDHVLKSYTSTYNDPTLADVTLVSDDNIAVSAHKFILSSASPVLRKFFTGCPNSNTQCLFMFGLSNNVLRSILEFVYTGETMVKSEELEAFLRGARKLDLNGVKTLESQTACNNLNNSIQAAQQELNILMPRSTTPLEPKRSKTFHENKKATVTFEQRNMSLANEEGEIVEDERFKLLDTSETLQPHTNNISSQAEDIRGKLRKEPFSCGICDRVFQYRSNLKSHVALKHKSTGY